MKRVVLVDDQALMRAGLRSLVERDGDLVVVAEAADGRAALSAVRTQRPDVVLMDLRMPLLDGVAATAEIRRDADLAAVRVLVLTTFDDEADVLTAIRAGADGYLLKTASPDELRSAVRTVADGCSTLATEVTRTVLDAVAAAPVRAVQEDLLPTLTEREREVLRQVGLGRRNDELAAVLHLSPATVRTYVSRLIDKLGVRDRTQLAVLAFDAGLVVPGAGAVKARE